MRLFLDKKGLFGGYQDHLGPSGSILELLMSLIGYLGLFWEYFGINWVQVGANWNFLGLSGLTFCNVGQF